MKTPQEFVDEFWRGEVVPHNSYVGMLRAEFVAKVQLDALHDAVATVVQAGVKNGVDPACVSATDSLAAKIEKLEKVAKELKVKKLHINSHERLHRSFDLLLADYFENNKESSTSNPLLSLMQWSCKQTKNTDHEPNKAVHGDLE